MKKRFFWILKLAITVFLITWLVERVDWKVVFHLVQGLSVPLLLLYVGFQLAGTLISARKWQYLSQIQGFSFSLTTGFFQYLTGAFINNFLPSTIGGDAYRTLWLGRQGDRWTAFSVVLYDRISGLLALFLLASFGFFVIPWDVWLRSPWLIILAGCTFSLTAFLCAGLWASQRIFQWLLRFVEHVSVSIGALLRRLENFTEARVYRQSIGYGVGFAVVGVALNNYMLFQSLGAEVHFFSFFGVIFLATLVANIPLSINNIGIKEWSYIFFFGLVGVSGELAVTVVLLSRVIQLLLSLGALPGYWRQRRE